MARRPSAGYFACNPGVPAPAITEAGALPAGVTFTDNGNNTATLAGTPAPGSGGTYVLGITANNGVGTAPTQTFTYNPHHSSPQTTPALGSFEVVDKDGPS